MHAIDVIDDVFGSDILLLQQNGLEGLVVELAVHIVGKVAAFGADEYFISANLLLVRQIVQHRIDGLFGFTESEVDVRVDEVASTRFNRLG